MEYINLEYYFIDDLKGIGCLVVNLFDVSLFGLKVFVVFLFELKV